MVWWWFGGLLVLGAGVIAWLMIETLLRRMWHRIQRARIARYLRRHPTAGTREESGSYCYRCGLLTVRYHYQPERRPPDHIGGFHITRTLSRRERFVRTALAHCRAWCSVQGMLKLCRWRVGGAVAIAFLFCLLLTESAASRAHRMEWLVGMLLRTSPASVHVTPHGWVTVRAQRRTEGDHVMEPVTLVVHPGLWLMGQDDAASVVRHRGKPYGVVRHPLQVTNQGDVWLHKDRQWHTGRLAGPGIIWDNAEGTGVRAGLVQQQTLPEIEDSSSSPR